MSEIQNYQTTVVKSSNNTSMPRKLIISALLIHLFSLFLPYRDSPYYSGIDIGGIIMQGNDGKTGFEEKPYAVYVIIGLLVLFLTNLYKEPLWNRFVYWISFVLLIWFAFGGAPFRTSGGKLAMFCLALVLLAAYLNERELKKKNDSSESGT